MAEEKIFPISDFSGGVQLKTSRFLQKDNELNFAQNAKLDEVGGISKSGGYAQRASDLTSTTSTSSSTSTTTTSTSTSTSTSTTTSTSTS